MRISDDRKPLVLLVAFGLAVASSAAVLAADGPNLLRLGELTLVKSAASLEAWEVEVDASVLARRSPVVSIDLLDGRRHRIEGRRVETRGPGDLAWHGRFEDGGQAILTLKDGYVAGLLFAPDGIYELTTSEGGQLLQKLDPESFEPCAHEDDGTFGFYEALSLPAAKVPASNHDRGPVTKSDFFNIDIMTVWTPPARVGAGGAAQIAATAQAAIDASNTALANSEVPVRFTLVHTSEVDYVDSGNIQADRNWLRNSPAVQAMRDEHDADLVGMLVENGAGFCGIAFLLGNQDPAAFAPNGYQVTARSCAVGNLTYAHEHGHNMGLQHNPESGAPPSQASFPWSYGHYHNGHYRTVMALSSSCIGGCPRHPYFSNPDVFFQGLPTGIANQRDNARTLGLIAPFTAEYRPIICDSPDCSD